METNSLKKISVDQTLELLDKNMADYQRLKPVPFEEFLTILNAKPSQILRNIFQAFHDMIKSYVVEPEETISEEGDQLSFTNYDCSKLFVEGSETPFFTDMLFANRFMKQNGVFEAWGPAKQNLYFLRTSRVREKYIFK